ncbi:CZB domain-containing protein [Pseudoxanthomonas mexicana]|uniref:CZB domain-containing protein n=1 Tax=Pseudoxanthomonas mexicana TaxID=128785 RepID=UPI00398A9911
MIQAHHAWKMKLKRAMKGEGERLEPAVIGRDDACALGKWIHGPGQQVDGLREYRDLKRLHMHFHRTAGDIARAIHLGHHEQAETMLEGEFTRSTQETLVAIRALKQRVQAG